MTQPTTARTCDALGVCQAHATPCTGCGNTHPAYHHLHRVHHAPTPVRACTADQCQQGRTACPCPQACELPGADADPLHDDPMTAMELAVTAIALAIAIALVVFAVKTALGA